MNIFITGASSGLGLYLAKEFILKGDVVWGIARREFNPNDKGFRYSQCDITSFIEIKDTFSEMVKADFIPDIAILCAGSAIDDIMEQGFRIDKYRENFNINLFGALYWVEFLLPYFLKRGRGIFAAISSMSVFRENHKYRIGYSASKSALNKSFENLRLEYLDTAIKFIIFNMGRMKEKRDLIGTSYAKAAGSIVKVLKRDRLPHVVNIPFSQFLLTRTAICIPEALFKKYL